MNDTDDKNIRCLMALLDDDNDRSAGLAMAELLKFDDDEIGGFLREYQESCHRPMRRHVHQLQAALSARTRRKVFTSRMGGRNIGLLEGLIHLHLTWYDKDAPECIRDDWNKLVSDLHKFAPDSTESMAVFMKKRFSVPDGDDFDPPYNCLGPVLETGKGSDVMLTAVGVCAARAAGFAFDAVRVDTDFGIGGKDGCVAMPSDGWKTIKSNSNDLCYAVRWGSEELLRFIGSILYTCAMTSDSFRYVYTLGLPLAASAGLSGLDTNPYPYNVPQQDKKGK